MKLLKQTTTKRVTAKADASSKSAQSKSSKKSTDGGELMEVKSSKSFHNNKGSGVSTAFAKGAKKSQLKAGKKRY